MPICKTQGFLTRHTNHDNMELGVLPLLNIPHDNEWLHENEHIGYSVAIIQLNSASLHLIFSHYANITMQSCTAYFSVCKDDNFQLKILYVLFSPKT